MRLYLSGGFVYQQSWDKEKNLQLAGAVNRLYSFFYIRKKRIKETFLKLIEEGISNVMIDSGAHSVATTKESISIEEYANWLLTLNLDLSKHVFVNLDVVPFQHGDSMPTVQQFDKSAAEGWENLRYMESLGLHPIHVFHGGESWSWLKKLMDNYEYIGVAASRLSVGVSARYSWLDTFWNRVTDDKGFPIRKVHGFALTSPEIMIRYPWFSLDSSSWNQFGVYGELLVPCFNKTRLVYSHIGVSPCSPSQRKDNKHFNSLSNKDKEVVVSFINSCGFTLEQVLHENVGSEIRDKINIKCLILIEKEVSKRKQSLVFQKGFFE